MPRAGAALGPAARITTPLGEPPAPTGSAGAAEIGVFGYLVKPFREVDLVPAIETARARHDELVALRSEAASLAEALAARKVIERAKGLLMEREGLSEREAFSRLRRASQLSGRPISTLAEAIVAALG